MWDDPISKEQQLHHITPIWTADDESGQYPRQSEIVSDRALAHSFPRHYVARCTGDSIGDPPGPNGPLPVPL